MIAVLTANNPDNNWASASVRQNVRQENRVADTLAEASAEKRRQEKPSKPMLFDFADNRRRQAFGNTPVLTTHLPPTKKGQMRRQGFLGKSASQDRQLANSYKTNGRRLPLRSPAPSPRCNSASTPSSAPRPLHSRARGTPRANRPTPSGHTRGGNLHLLKCHAWPLVTSAFPFLQAFRGFRPGRALNAHYLPAPNKGISHD